MFGRVEQRFRAQLNRARSTSSDIPSGGNGSTRDGDADALVSANRAEVGVAMATGEAAGGGAVAACGVLGGLDLSLLLNSAFEEEEPQTATQAEAARGLPKALSKLKGLASLELTSNPKLVWPPPDVAAQGAAAVRTWLANAEDREPPVDLDANIIPLAGTQWGTGVPLYAHEPEGSMHMPLPQVSPDGHGGGEFIFPATSR